MAVNDPAGYLITGGSFSAALSAAPAGSTHFLLQDGGYDIWADEPWALFITDAANDPGAVPAVQQSGWPGVLISEFAIVQFIFDSTQSVLVGFPVGVVVTPTGIRAWTLGGAGTFYVSQFRTRTV